MPEVNPLNHYAVVIGISHYPSIGDNVQVPEAVAGAEQFRSWLVEDAGLPEKNILLIVSTEASGTVYKERIDGDMRGFYDQVPKTAERLYFYFSGHGVSPNQADHILMTSDADRELPFESMVRTAYEQCLRRWEKFPEQFVFVDSCRKDDHLFVGMPPSKWCRGTGASFVYQHRFYATSYLGLAYVSRESRVGCFTTALIEGLRKADGGNGFVTPISLRNWIELKVPGLAEKQGFSQIPEVELDSKRDLPIVTVAHDLIDLIVETDGHEVVFYQETAEKGRESLEKGRFPVENGIAKLRLLPGEYLMQSIPSNAARHIVLSAGQPKTPDGVATDR